MYFGLLMRLSARHTTIPKNKQTSRFDADFDVVFGSFAQYDWSDKAFVDEILREASFFHTPSISRASFGRIFFSNSDGQTALFLL